MVLYWYSRSATRATQSRASLPCQDTAADPTTAQSCAWALLPFSNIYTQAEEEIATFDAPDCGTCAAACVASGQNGPGSGRSPDDLDFLFEPINQEMATQKQGCTDWVFCSPWEAVLFENQTLTASYDQAKEDGYCLGRLRAPGPLSTEAFREVLSNAGDDVPADDKVPLLQPFLGGMGAALACLKPTGEGCQHSAGLTPPGSCTLKYISDPVLADHIDTVRLDVPFFSGVSRRSRRVAARRCAGRGGLTPPTGLQLVARVWRGRRGRVRLRERGLSATERRLFGWCFSLFFF